MKHPNVEDLALYAGGELGAFGRLRVAVHIASCEDCRRETGLLRQARETLRDEARRLPEGLDWNPLEAEMKANIRLGLAAGAIVDRVAAPPERLGWRAAAGLAMATLVVVTGWFLNVPRPGELAQAGVVLEATQAGLELKENGRALTMLEPASTAVTYSVNAAGSLRARYVDGDTGQVTITNVYAQ
jgi:anti-sigma factor RsiW